MRLLIIGFAKIKYMPYINFYLNHIEREHEIHVLYWNRDKQKEDLSKYDFATFHEFSEYQEDNVAPFLKVRNFLKFRMYLKKFLKRNKFDFIICLHTFSAFLIADVLRRQYAGRYIFDYRDSTYESFGLFRHVICNLVKNSYATFVSSDAFRKFMPQTSHKKIFTSHNLLLDSLDYRQNIVRNKVESDKIRVAFWGFIREEEINREIINKFARDDRFELHYYGREQQIALQLKQYVSDIKSNNIFFHGSYQPEERYEFAKKTDIIHNIYCDDNMMMAMGNKYYDSMIFYIPQVCMEGAYMANEAVKNGLGIACNPYKDDFTEKIYQYYTGLDMKKYMKDCDDTLSAVLQEYNDGVNIIRKIIR